MKILLLRPYYGVTVNSDMLGDFGIVEYQSQVFPDISMVISASIAKQNNNVEVQVIDANAEKLFPKDLIDKKITGDYDFIFLKTAGPTIGYDIQFAKKLKEINKAGKVVLAGHSAKILKRWILKNVPQIDEVIEIPFEDYVYNLFNEESIKENYISIGMFPVMDYSLFPFDKYTDNNGNKRVSLYLSRGCPEGCSYCPYTNYFSRRYDIRSIDSVIRDLKAVIDLGISTVQFRDQYFTCNKKIVMQLCQEIINQKIKVRWRCETRLESLDEELIDFMVEAGLELICFGVEAASNDTLSAYNRLTYDYERIQKLLSYLKKKNVITLAFYIIGFKEDTWVSITNTFELSKKIQSNHAKFSIFFPFEYLINQLGTNENELLVPEIFSPFENTLKLKSCDNLGQEELRYLFEQITMLHAINSTGFRDTYNYHYLEKVRVFQKIKALTQKINENTIFGTNLFD